MPFLASSNQHYFQCKWGETFGLDFSLKIDQWSDNKLWCPDIVRFEMQNLHPGAYYCPEGTHGRIGFETILKQGVNVVKKAYPLITELHKMYHIQMKQFHANNKLRRIMKIDGNIVEDYEIENQPTSGEILFEVRDIDDVGGHIYNLKVTH